MWPDERTDGPAVSRVHEPEVREQQDFFRQGGKARCDGVKWITELEMSVI